MVLRTVIAAGIAATAGAALTARAAKSRTEAAQESHPPLGEFVEVDGVNVHYLQKGQGPHLILLHGAGGNLREFSFDMIDQLTDRYTVTAVDRPGLGYTERLPEVDPSPFALDAESPQGQAHLLRKFAAKIGIEKPIVAGHSYGCIVGMAWAVEDLSDPDNPACASAVVSFGGVTMPWEGTLNYHYRIYGSRLGGGLLTPIIGAFTPQSYIDQVIEGIFAPQPVPEGYADYIGAGLTIRPENYRANMRQVKLLLPHVQELAKSYPDLKLPIEVVHGDEDKSVPFDVHPAELIKILPDTNVVKLKGVGHMPHYSDRTESLEAIDRAAKRAGLR